MNDIEIHNVDLKSCSLNLGELHRITDYGYFHPVFECITKDGEEFTARMRLHITEPLDPIIFLDPRAYDDFGQRVNSANSPVMRRKNSYATDNAMSGDQPIFLGEIPADVRCFKISADQIQKAVINGYSLPDLDASGTERKEIAFTCHDPSVIGGGNLILFRYINWLSELGIKVRVYTCGSLPFWTRVPVKFRVFPDYKEMFSAIEESTIVLFAMWHIEPMLKVRPLGKRIFILHQGVVSYHYGHDENSMLVEKPVIDLLEGLPLGVITISPYLREKYSRADRKENHFIPNGVDSQIFHASDRIAKNDNVIRVVTVGSPNYCLKGTRVLAEALIKLSDRYEKTKFMWIACSGDKEIYTLNGIRNARNIEYVHRINLNKQEMRDIYRSADLFVNVSFNEGFGLPSLEAMSCGIPIVQADNGGLREIVTHGRDCLVVPINDADATAEAIVQIINDSNLARRLVENGYETARKNNMSNQFEKFCEAFENICGINFDVNQRKIIRNKIDSGDKAVLGYETRKQGIDNRPLVSIVIPTYNQAKYLREALDSIIAQTYTHWEAIVVNDGSLDNTVEVMQQYEKIDNRIRTFSKQNGGISSALNYGIKNAVGEYFCWLSSDDLFYDYKLEEQIKQFRELDDSYALIYGGYDLLIQSKNRIEILDEIKSIEPGAEFPELLKHDFIYGCSVMIRRDVIKEIGAFHPHFRHAQDTEFWLRIAARGYRFFLMNKKLAIRREHSEQASTGNIIYCRYDAVCMIDYYLSKYHLFEMYRYFNINDADDTARFVNHLVGRMYGDDPTANHPLLREKLWDWIDAGLEVLTPDKQRLILKRCLDIMSRMKIWHPNLKYYTDKCKMSLEIERVQKSVDIDYAIGPDRNILLNNRDKDDIGKKLFTYAADLLVNKNTPLFAQTLKLNNTNKLVNNRFKLAHSVIRYLAQYKNDFQDSCLSFRDISFIPKDQKDATRLFYNLYFPEESEWMIALTEYDKGYIDQSVAVNERSILQMSDERRELIRSVCSKGPTEKMLHYWNAILFANEGNYSRATIEALKAKNKKSMTIIRNRRIQWSRKTHFKEIIIIITEVQYDAMHRIRRRIYYHFYFIKDRMIFPIKTVNKLLSVLFVTYLNNYKAGKYVYALLKNLRNKLFKISFNY